MIEDEPISIEPEQSGDNFPPRHPSFLWKCSSYALVAFLVVPTAQIFMRLLNRTRMIGKKNVSRLDPPWILMSNHVTLLDDLFLGPIVFFPRALYKWKEIPYHAPEERNFYKVPIVSWFMKKTKSIPVMRGKGIYQEGVKRLIEAVKEGGVLHIYPEGTRTRSGELMAAKAGIGRIVYESNAAVAPMYHRGLDRVLPIGAGVPRIGQKIYVAIGEPLFFDEERKLPNTPDTWRLITGRIMAGIRQQRDLLENQFGPALKPHRVSSHVRKQLDSRSEESDK